MLFVGLDVSTVWNLMDESRYLRKDESARTRFFFFYFNYYFVFKLGDYSNRDIVSDSGQRWSW